MQKSFPLRTSPHRPPATTVARIIDSIHLCQFIGMRQLCHRRSLPAGDRSTRAPAGRGDFSSAALCGCCTLGRGPAFPVGDWRQQDRDYSTTANRPSLGGQLRTHHWIRQPIRV